MNLRDELSALELDGRIYDWIGLARRAVEEIERQRSTIREAVALFGRTLAVWSGSIRDRLDAETERDIRAWLARAESPLDEALPTECCTCHMAASKLCGAKYYGVHHAKWCPMRRAPNAPDDPFAAMVMDQAHGPAAGFDPVLGAMSAAEPTLAALLAQLGPDPEAILRAVVAYQAKRAAFDDTGRVDSREVVEELDRLDAALLALDRLDAALLAAKGGG